MSSMEHSKLIAHNVLRMLSVFTERKNLGHTDLEDLPCRWKLLPEIFLGILCAKKYAQHIPLLWTTRIF